MICGCLAVFIVICWIVIGPEIVVGYLDIKEMMETEAATTILRVTFFAWLSLLVITGLLFYSVQCTV